MRSPVRRFLVLTTLAALLLGVVGASTAPAALAGPPPTNTRVAGIDVDATTIPQLEALMDAHRLSSVQLVQFYLHRIAKLNPKLHAVIRVSPTALADARAADRARRAGADQPLLGIPVIVKDNVDTTGMPTTAGSWALAGRPRRTPSSSSGCERPARSSSPRRTCRSGPTSGPARRRAAGAGSEARRTWPTSSIATPAARAPAPASASRPISPLSASAPRPTARSSARPAPMGSSGSSRRSGCGAGAGIVPISADQDTAGPMARNVTDAAVLLGALTGVDPADPATADRPATRSATTPSSSTPTPSRAPGSGSGVTRTTSSVADPPTIAIFDETVAELESRGATVVDPAAIDFGDRLRRRVRRPPLRVQDRHRVVSRGAHRRRLPEDTGGPDRFQQRPSRAGGPV